MPKQRYQMKKKQRRIQLVLISIGLLLFVLTYLYYPNIDKDKLLKDQSVKKDFEEVGTDDQITVFEDMEYRGLYDIDKPFKVQSETAYILNKEPDIVYMKNMHVTLYLNDERIVKFKSKPILTAKSISKSFDGRIILRKIDVSLNQGEMLGLLGSNGAGKSTFMNIVLGLLKPDFGKIFLDNSNLTNLAIHERSKLGIAYLPQQTSIFRGLTVYENLLAIAQIVMKETVKQKEVVEKLMAEFSITHLRDVKAIALSGGERRRVEIARCLINNPTIKRFRYTFSN